MNLLRLSSPHVVNQGSTGHVMLLVVLATLPGLTMATYFFGWGTLINVLWAIVVAIACEAVIVKLRGRPVGFYLGDFSAIVTALLIGLSLPPLSPWWLVLIATSFAIIVAKHLYGGLGQNPFNPAMAGYALVLIAFPVEMTSWLAPRLVTANADYFDLVKSLNQVFPFVNGLINEQLGTIDAYTMATPLDVFKHKGADVTAAEIWRQAPTLSSAGWAAWQYISVAYLLGGIYLIYRKVFTWHAPLSMLFALTVIASIFYTIDPNQYGAPELHLLGGATMLGAFFIVTDPVTSATSVKGRLYYGAGIGILIYVIRTWGAYPDAVAFAVLLMNFAAPLIDYYTQPRSYGHRRSGSGARSRR